MKNSVTKVTVILGDPTLQDQTKIEQRFSKEDFLAVDRMKSALSELPEYRFSYLEDHSRLLNQLSTNPPEFVLNFCDTGFKNQPIRELQVPALLDMLEIPYTGSGPTCLGLCYDKALVRMVAAALGVPVPGEIYYDMSDPDAPLPEQFPVLIKPNVGDGSVGITQNSVVETPKQAKEYLDELRRQWPERDALIQEFLSGTEYGVALIGNPEQGFTCLPPLEVDYSELEKGLPQILSYESKTIPESPYWTQIKYREARLDEPARNALFDYAKRLFQRLGLRDYGRFDFRADKNGVIKLIEINPNPAWCWDGKMNFMAGFAGHSYADLLRIILEAGQRRVAEKL